LKTKQVSMQVQGIDQTIPPPATRHRAVMSFHKPVPLYDMRSHPSSSFEDILQSSRNAEKVMMVMTVTTGRISRVEEEPNYLELLLSFYSPHDYIDHVNQPPRLDVKVIMPEGWTPKMYLGALNKSIMKHSVISLELIPIDRQSYATVNELQWLFSATKEATHSQLTCSASYIRVSGGVLK
jgi:hypothetical protein